MSYIGFILYFKKPKKLFWVNESGENNIKKG